MMTTIMRLMNRILPSCEEVSHLTSQAMDETLPWRERLALRMHLRMCIWCRRNAEQLQLMRNLACRLAHSEKEPARLSSDARHRIAESLGQSDETS